MNDVWIMGIDSTPVGRFPDKEHTTLVREACVGAMADAQLRDPGVIGGIWFGNVSMDYWGTPYTRGQYSLAPLVHDGLMPKGIPTINVEAGCATGSLAFHGAVNSILAGKCDVALAVGVEKMYVPNDQKGYFKHIEDSIDAKSIEMYKQQAELIGTTFEPGFDRSAAMDLYALWALTHANRYGTTQEHLAIASSKNHCNAVGNPRAQYRFPLTVDEVLQDREVVYPITRAMCAPVGDGSAAVLVCSGKHLKTCSAEVQERAVRIRANELANGIGMFDVSWEDDRAPVIAARRAYEAARLTPEDVDIVELHDATSFAEIQLVEDLGFCRRGEGGAYTASGATARDGEVAVNPSGGLVSRGHPLGATGIVMLNELCLQLRGEADEIQVDKVKIGMAENGGGVLGNDIAMCSITILDRPG